MELSKEVNDLIGDALRMYIAGGNPPSLFDSFANILTAIQPLANLIIAITLAIIAWLQMKTNKERFDHELFDRQIKIIKAIKTWSDVIKASHDKVGACMVVNLIEQHKGVSQEFLYSYHDLFCDIENSINNEKIENASRDIVDSLFIFRKHPDLIKQINEYYDLVTNVGTEMTSHARRGRIYKDAARLIDCAHGITMAEHDNREQLENLPIVISRYFKEHFSS